ncbi:hypothetical protein N9F18_00335 [bacterium]|nr:hypothetical protein [bacterium]
MRRNINPKTLKGQDKLNRMLDLMGKMNTLNESKSYSELELVKKGPNGIVYGIVRENHDYFIKTSNKTSGKFLAEDFSYVGGLKNKYDERYNSYAESIKHLNMKFDMLNESYGIDSNTNIFESDGVAFGGGTGFGFVMEEDDEDDEKNEEKKEIISDADADLEEQKKVLKVDTPKAEEPVEDEVDVDMGGDIADVEFDEETEEGGDEFGDEGMEDEEGDEDGDTKKIQKYTGKIGQMLRDMGEADLDLEKYVINSIISAMHLDEMDEEDKEDIIEKIESGDEEEGDDFDMEGGDEEVDVDLDAEETTEETPEEGEEKELSEGEDKEDDDDDDEKEVVKVKKEQLKMLEEEGICTCGDKCLIYPGAEDVDAEDLLKQGSKSGKECIILTDDNMSDLKSEGECKCGGVKLKCKKDKEEKNEGRVFSKKQLMESFLRNTTKKSLKRVLRERRELCEECGSRLTEGMCMECGPNEHHMGKSSPGQYDREAYIMDEEDIMNEKLVGKQHKLDRNKNGKIDAEDFKMLRKGRKDRRRNIDEDEEMSVMDAIATGQGYLDTTNDLDRDFDGIPNRLDMDNNDDGELDFSMNSDKGEDFIELDIDFLRNSEAPVKEPGIKEPTTKPGKGDKWRTIKRPKVDPRPKADKRMDRSDKPRPSYRRRGMFR